MLDICQVAALNFATFWRWVAYVHMCVCYVHVWLMFVHMCVKRSWFEVHGGESESMSDQYHFFCVAIY